MQPSVKVLQVNTIPDSDSCQLMFLNNSPIDYTSHASVSSLNTSCGADSFMLRDSVCDEVTNNKKCLFDGGDCCLEIKDTTLCQNCSCILTVEPKKLHQTFSELQIKPPNKPGKIDKAIEDWTVKVDDVISGQVCAVFCLDSEKGDTVNAWQYQENKRGCKCGWIKSTICPEDLVQTDWKLDSVRNLTQSPFIMLERTLPCSKAL